MGVVQVPVAEAEYYFAGQRVKEELKSGADLELRGIYEFDPHRIRVAQVELVGKGVASVSSTCHSNRSFLLWLSLSTTAETKLRQRSAVRKVDCRD